MTQRLRFSIALVLGALSACGPQSTEDAGVTDTGVLDSASIDAAGDDASSDTGQLADVVSERPFVASGCPAPQTIAPTTALTGFLPAVNVDFVRTVDGDTAHFLVGGTETVVRFMYINAEETHGAETTAFGLATVPIVTAMLRSARLQIAPQRGSNGMPNLDTYGRTLALVFADGELVQTRVVREGLSAYYTQFGCAPAPAHLSLLYAEAEARANQRGIWAPGHPTNYAEVLGRWIGRSTCRPNPFMGQPYCR
ncbi:MAG: thermonuclease family protein [Myxococcales bacterium]|nr:thermonuclease family protein [Myxococcales bacterium]